MTPKYLDKNLIVQRLEVGLDFSPGTIKITTTVTTKTIIKQMQLAKTLLVISTLASNL